MYKVNIIGGSGYAGGELLRILINHPYVEINQVTSKNFVGKNITTIHPNLRGKINKNFCSINDLKECDVIFVALPNLESMKYINKISTLAKYVIDLGADFRIKNLDLFKEYYQTEHLAKDWIKKFVYAVPEINKNEIKKSNYLVCPGCEAISIILPIYPLLKEGIINSETKIIADVKIGSSAAGSKPSLSTHHPERNNVVRTYKAVNHRHKAEIIDFLNLEVEITATAIEIVRGILSTIHILNHNQNISEKDIWQIYFKYYQNEKFIRIIKQKEGLYRLPEPKIIWGTNYCDIGFELDKKNKRLVILSAIDNLVKGTAGQAVQCMNIILNLPEESGLDFIPLHPI
ncbi:MAG: N-acetyl-gamma-glutamyl-phosphate reductase [Candidatus Parcubacteria bacterium]|nr:MAG: N-acetyl-gamma-glutamyl-phosphate reductase [Candidatus Parcubacteria bacterium]